MIELIEKIIRQRGFYIIHADTLKELEEFKNFYRWGEFLKKGYKISKCEWEEHFLIKSI